MDNRYMQEYHHFDGDHNDIAIYYELSDLRIDTAEIKHHHEVEIEREKRCHDACKVQVKRP